MSPNAIVKVLRYALIADASVNLLKKVITFVHGEDQQDGEHTLTDAEIRHIKNGGTIVFQDQAGNEVHRHG
ncbi:MAG: hypothetical protein AAGG48_07930 [Planctomycetota bacterium]